MDGAVGAAHARPVAQLVEPEDELVRRQGHRGLRVAPREEARHLAVPLRAALVLLQQVPLQRVAGVGVQQELPRDAALLQGHTRRGVAAGVVRGTVLGDVPDEQTTEGGVTQPDPLQQQQDEPLALGFAGLQEGLALGVGVGAGPVQHASATARRLHRGRELDEALLVGVREADAVSVLGRTDTPDRGGPWAPRVGTAAPPPSPRTSRTALVAPHPSS